MCSRLPRHLASFAAEVPFSGDTSDFGGDCSEPVDVVWRFRWVGLDGVFGHIDGTLTVRVKAEWGVDAETGQLRSFISWVKTGTRTGRFAGATLCGTTHCRWYDPGALMAGIEPELCVMQGMIHDHPFAGLGE